MSLLAATRSEVTKVLTTSTWWILAVVLVVYVGSTAGGLSWLFGALQTGALPADVTTGAPPVAPGTLAPTMYSVASSIGYVFPLLIGTLMATSEFRHQTLTPTFLATPRRGVALGGKLAAALLIGALYALVAIIAVVVPSALVFASLGIDTGLGTADTWWFLARAFAALILWALIGVGLGALIRNQVAAIVIVLAFTQVIEPILRIVGSFVEWINTLTRFLPGAASDALVGKSFSSSLGGVTAADSGALEWWQGGLVLLGFAIIFAVLGQLFSWRRDVT
ncbi:MAG TPA: ABC transporter permease [Microbacteriaceae bacterium]|nr:ABC transporter permease [Microbacteriaceae bacterium]HQZ47103.1 ABC transporter permease [Microbacteriaceae bacterium]HRA08003.1 ABC transporter permease [Microbacteriaceae bacterium]